MSGINKRATGVQAPVKRRRAAPSIASPVTPDSQRWLLSYADFITLLCAFFIMLYAMSEVDRRQGTNLLVELQNRINSLAELPNGIAEGEAESMALQKQPIDAADQPHRGNQPLQVAQRYVDKVAQLFPASADTKVTKGPDWVSLSLAGEFLFDDSEYLLSPQARQAVAELAAEIRRWPYTIRVYGHTGIRPDSAYDSNWQLSAMRAASVAEALAGGGVAPQRLEATGIAHYHALATALDDERVEWQMDASLQPQQNRVDVVLSVAASPTPWNSQIPESNSEPENTPGSINPATPGTAAP